MTEPPDDHTDGGSTDGSMDGEPTDGLPEAVADEAERLTRLARDAETREGPESESTSETDVASAPEGGREAAAARDERDELLAEHGYTARERVDEGTRRGSEETGGGTRGVTLVCYPEEWIDDGTIRFDLIEDTARAVERPLDVPASEADWESVDAHNRRIAEQVGETHGPVHGANATAFAAFMSNHYARPIESATDRMREEFLTEYFPRNAWPTDEQRSLVEESVAVAVETARN
jgi:hypothetical protein